MLQKHWLLLLILTSSLVTGCKGTLPIRPHTDICRVSAPLPTPQEPEPFQGCICSDGEKVWRLSFQECDSYVAFVPEQLFNFSEYVLELEKLASKGCRMQVKTATEIVNEFGALYRLTAAVP